MKKTLKFLLAGILAAGSITVCAAAYGKFSDSVTVTNHISTGDINIALKELEKKNGREVSYQDGKTILPGDRISKIPRITNKSEPCWIRVKITYADNLNGQKGLDDASLSGMSSLWLKKGEYFYYRRQLKYGESADVFTGVAVPKEWTEVYQGKKLGITIMADAIQAANFVPDFTAMTPWGNQKIQRCVHDTDGLIVKKKSPVRLSVEFKGKAHKLIAAPDDFFSGFSTAMPGDVFEDSVEIGNSTENTAEIFFRTSSECKSVKDQEFLKKLKLEIFMDGKKLYTGDILAASLNKAVSLGEFAKGKSGKMIFKVTVPAELDNTYALRDGNVKWIFSTEGEKNMKTVTETPVPEQPEKEKISKEKLCENEKNNSVVKTKSVKTGDDTEIWLFVFLGCTALLSGCLVIWKGGKRA